MPCMYCTTHVSYIDVVKAIKMMLDDGTKLLALLLSPTPKLPIALLGEP